MTSEEDSERDQRVCALVVTHDRLDLLRECLGALRAQSRPPDEILVVDNASTDGTAAAVREAFPAVTLVELTENVGGAGGFHEGIRLALGRGHDWVWLMDDDTVPTETALERLLEPLGGLSDEARPLILASKVLWDDGRLHPMNIPRTHWRRKEELIDAAGHGLLLIRSASFVSLMVHRDAITRHGMPHGDWFIWNDDLEFTARVLRRGRGYLVPRSVVRHRTPAPYAPLYATGERFYYEARNKLLMLRGDAWDRREKALHLVGLARAVTRFVAANPNRGAAARIAFSGLRDGLLGRTS